MMIMLLHYCAFVRGILCKGNPLVDSSHRVMWGFDAEQNVEQQLGFWLNEMPQCSCEFIVNAINTPMRWVLKCNPMASRTILYWYPIVFLVINFLLKEMVLICWFISMAWEHCDSPSVWWIKIEGTSGNWKLALLDCGTICQAALANLCTWQKASVW